MQCSLLSSSPELSLGDLNKQFTPLLGCRENSEIPERSLLFPPFLAPFIRLYLDHTFVYVKRTRHRLLLPMGGLFADHVQVLGILGQLRLGSRPPKLLTESSLTLQGWTGQRSDLPHYLMNKDTIPSWRSVCLVYKESYPTYRLKRREEKHTW